METGIYTDPNEADPQRSNVERWAFLQDLQMQYNNGMLSFEEAVENIRSVSISDEEFAQCMNNFMNF